MNKNTFLLVLTLGVLAINNLSAQTLEAHFKFDTDLTDETGTYTLSTTNAASIEYVAGADGTAKGAVSGFGISDYLETTSNISITGAADRTVTAWIKTDAGTNGSQTSRGIVNMGHRGTSRKFTLLLVNNAVRNDIQGAGDVTGPLSIKDDAWHLLAVVFDGTANTSTIYVDAVSKKVIDWGTAEKTLATSARPLLIGNEVFDDKKLPRLRGFEGAIDDVRVYRGTLTQLEIAALYNVGD